MRFDYGHQHDLVAVKFGIRRLGHAAIMTFVVAQQQRILSSPTLLIGTGAST